MDRARRSATVAAVGLALAVMFGTGHRIEAHKPVTSPYSYNEHVFPILRDHCGQCHVEGGAAPMSLLTYNDQSGGAFAWAQAIREMLVSQAMPPWYADPTGPPVEHPHALSSRDLDIVVTWASGGAPEGDASNRPKPTAGRPTWTLGKPDLVLSMPASHAVSADTAQEMFEVTLPTNLSAPRWVRAADLLPGAPSMVRRAVISVVDGPVLREWEPGDDVSTAPEGTAFQLPARARVHLQIFYKKSWQEEKDAKTDRSSVGLYFLQSQRSAAAIETVTLNGPKAQGDGPVAFSGTMPQSGRVLAVRPRLDRAYRSLNIAAVTSSGMRMPLLKLHAARPEWPRRYWLVQPVVVPAEAKIEITGTPAVIEPGAPTTAADSPLEVSVDFTPQ